MKKFIIGFMIYAILFFSGYLIYHNFFNQEDIVDEELGKQLIRQVEDQSTDEHHEHSGEGLGYETNHDMIVSFQNEENVLAFLLAAIKENNPKMFADCFTAEQYMLDLFKVSDEPFKENTTQYFMNEISRGGKLERIEILKGEEKYQYSESGKVNVVFIYSDKRKVKLTIEMGMVGTKHKPNDDIYYISTSVLEIINKIRNQA